MLLAVLVHSAAVQDRYGVRPLLKELSWWFPRLRVVFADGAYAGRLVTWVAGWYGWVLSIVRKGRAAPRFVPLPKRWVVERTFAWLTRYRRLCRDYEQRTCNSETMVRLAMINLMLHRLAPERPTS